MVKQEERKIEARLFEEGATLDEQSYIGNATARGILIEFPENTDKTNIRHIQEVMQNPPGNVKAVGISNSSNYSGAIDTLTVTGIELAIVPANQAELINQQRVREGLAQQSFDRSNGDNQEQQSSGEKKYADKTLNVEVTNGPAESMSTQQATGISGGTFYGPVAVHVTGSRVAQYLSEQQYKLSSPYPKNITDSTNSWQHSAIGLDQTTSMLNADQLTLYMPNKAFMQGKICDESFNKANYIIIQYADYNQRHRPTSHLKTYCEKKKMTFSIKENGLLNFDEVNLDNKDLSLCDFSQVSFWQASFKHAILKETNLKKADISDANISWVKSLSAKQLSKAEFDQLEIDSNDETNLRLLDDACYFKKKRNKYLELKSQNAELKETKEVSKEAREQSSCKLM